MTYSHCIIGGGIVGLATAREILRRDPRARIVLVEKEAGFARHQTGHNSGVIHAGIYYAPGSLKARLCRLGEVATKDYCRTHGIPFETCGKLIVSTDASELERLSALFGRAHENGITVEELSAAQLARTEPEVAGNGAILVPSTGIVDYRQICDSIAAGLRDMGAHLRTGSSVTRIEEQGDGVRVTLKDGHVLKAGSLPVPGCNPTASPAWEA
jgi:L-2-hydroxyglutarate oxidase